MSIYMHGPHRDLLMNNRLCHWGPHALSSALGEHEGTPPTHTHTSSSSCFLTSVCKGRLQGGGGVGAAGLGDSPGPAQEWVLIDLGCVIKPAPHVPTADNESDRPQAKSIAPRKKKKKKSVCFWMWTIYLNAPLLREKNCNGGKMK